MLARRRLVVLLEWLTSRSFSLRSRCCHDARPVLVDSPGGLTLVGGCRITELLRIISDILVIRYAPVDETVVLWWGCENSLL